MLYAICDYRLLTTSSVMPFSRDVSPTPRQTSFCYMQVLMSLSALEFLRQFPRLKWALWAAWLWSDGCFAATVYKRVRNHGG